MISNEDYACVNALDGDKKAAYLKENPYQCAKTFLNLLSHVSKDTTIQYLLVMIDDLLQVRICYYYYTLILKKHFTFKEDRARVEIFLEYASRRKENVWGPFLGLLNRSDGFITNMASRIIAKLACWGHDQMPKSDLNFYLQWLKEQLTGTVSFKLKSYSFYFNSGNSCFSTKILPRL